MYNFVLMSSPSAQDLLPLVPSRAINPGKNIHRNEDIILPGEPDTPDNELHFLCPRPLDIISVKKYGVCVCFCHLDLTGAQGVAQGVFLSPLSFDKLYVTRQSVPKKLPKRAKRPQAYLILDLSPKLTIVCSRKTKTE